MGQGINVTLWLGSSCVPHGLCSISKWTMEKMGGTTHLLCYSRSSEQHRQNEHVSCSSLRCWSATHTLTNGGCTCHRSTKEKMKSHVEVTSVKRWRLTLDSSQSLPLVFEGPALFFLSTLPTLIFFQGGVSSCFYVSPLLQNHPHSHLFCHSCLSRITWSVNK